MKSRVASRIKQGIAVAAVFVSLSHVALAGDNEWVMPRAYVFGSCGGLGGDSVPGYLNQKYFTQHSCRRAFDTRQCYTQARWYEQQFAENRVASCGAWLQRELANCERFVEQEAQDCETLAK